MFEKISSVFASNELQITKYSLRLEKILLIALALSVCVSEPLSRNIIRIIFVMFAVKIFIGRNVITELLKRYKIFLLPISAFAWWMIISSIYGGDLVTDDDSNVYWFFFSHNMILFLPMILMIRRQKISARLLIFAAVSLLIDDVFIFWQLGEGITAPITFLNDSPWQSSMLYVILLPTLLILFLQTDKRRQKIFFAAMFAVSWTAFIFLYRQPAQILLMIIFALILLEKFFDLKKFLVLAVTAIIFLIAMPAELNPMPTVEKIFAERILIWQGTLDMIKANPIMGVGLGNYLEQYHGAYALPDAKFISVNNALNTYLQLWSETGIFGLTIFLAIFGGILFWSRRRRGNLYGQILFFATLSLMLYAATDFIFASYSAMRVYWFLFGICVASLDR